MAQTCAARRRPVNQSLHPVVGWHELFRRRRDRPHLPWDTRFQPNSTTRFRVRIIWELILAGCLYSARKQRPCCLFVAQEHNRKKLHP